MTPLSVADPLAHRALDGLLRAETTVRRRLTADLEREGLSGTGFHALVVLAVAGGAMELRNLRLRLGLSKASATEIVQTLVRRDLVDRRRSAHDRRALCVRLTAAGQETVDRLFPEHASRVAAAFGALDDEEKRTLAALCGRIAA